MGPKFNPSSPPTIPHPAMKWNLHGMNFAEPKYILLTALIAPF